MKKSSSQSQQGVCADPAEMQRQHLLQQVRNREVAIIRGIVRGEISPSDVQPSILLRARDLGEEGATAEVRNPEIQPPSPRAPGSNVLARDTVGPKMVAPIKPRPPPTAAAKYETDGLQVKKGVDRVAALFEKEGSHHPPSVNRMSNPFVNLEALPIPKPNTVPADITLEWEDVWPRGASLFLPKDGTGRDEEGEAIADLSDIGLGSQSASVTGHRQSKTNISSASHASFADTLPVLMRRWKEGARRLVHPPTIYLPSYSPDTLNIRSQALAVIHGAVVTPKGEGAPVPSGAASTEPEYAKVRQVCESLDRALILTRAGRLKKRPNPKASNKRSTKRRTSTDADGRPTSPPAPTDEGDRLMDEIKGHFNDLQALTFALHDISAVGFQRGNAVSAATMLCADQMRVSVQRLLKAWRGDEGPIVEAKQLATRLRSDIAQLQKDAATQRVRVDDLERQLSERTQELTRLQNRSQGGIRPPHIGSQQSAASPSPSPQSLSTSQTKAAMAQHSKDIIERNQQREEGDSQRWSSGEKDQTLRREKYAFSAKRVEAKMAAMGRELRKRPKATFDIGTTCDDLFFSSLGFKQDVYSCPRCERPASPTTAGATIPQQATATSDNNLFLPRSDLTIDVSVQSILGPIMNHMSRLGVRLAAQGAIATCFNMEGREGLAGAPPPDIFQGVVNALETITGRQLSEKLLYQLVRGVGTDTSVSRESQTTPTVGGKGKGLSASIVGPPKVAVAQAPPVDSQQLASTARGVVQQVPALVKTTTAFKSSKRDAASMNKTLSNSREMATTADSFTISLPAILYKAPLTFEHVLVSLVPHFQAAIDDGLASVVLRGPSGCEDMASPFFLFMNQDGMRTTVLETLFFILPERAVEAPEGCGFGSLGRLLYETMVLQMFSKYGSSSLTLAWIQSFGTSATRCLSRISAQRRLLAERSGEVVEDESRQAEDTTECSSLTEVLSTLAGIQYGIGHLWDAEQVAVAHGNERVIDGRPARKDLTLFGKHSVVSNVSEGFGSSDMGEPSDRSSVASAHLEARHMSALSCGAMLPQEPVSSQLLNTLFLCWTAKGFLPVTLFSDLPSLSGTALAVLSTLLHTTVALLKGHRIEDLYRGRLFITPNEALSLLAALVPAHIIEAAAYANATTDKHPEALLRNLLAALVDTQLPSLLASVSHVSNNLHWDTFATKLVLAWDRLVEPIFVAASTSLQVSVLCLRPWRVGYQDPIRGADARPNRAAMALSREATPLPHTM